MKLSIIIPVYGVEQYVEKCLHSVFNQDLPPSDFEIIVVNDGTKDNSWNIVKKVTDNYSNVCLVEQTNQGLSSARNHGLDLARGEYVWFIDSDDWIETNCLSEILYAAEGNDVLALSTMFKEGDWKGIKSYGVSSNTTDKLSYMNQDYPTPAQFYVCRKSFLVENNFRFVKGIKHEDCLFTPLILAKCTTFSVLTKPVYHFLKRADSITTIYDNKRGYDYCYIINQLYNYRDTISNNLILDRYDAGIARIIKEHLRLATKLDKRTQIDINSFYVKHKYILGCLLKSKYNSQILYFLYKYTPFNLVSIYGYLECVWNIIRVC